MEDEVKKPRKPRKKRVPDASKARHDPEKNLFKRMQQTEEGRKLWDLWRAKRHAPGVKLGRPQGAYDGFSRAERMKHKAVAKAEAKEIVKLMEKKGFEVPKHDFAREAIETAVELMRMTEMNAKDKLSAARTVLEWCMAKPVAQSEVSIKRAEDFLSLVEDKADAAEKK